MIGMPNYVKIRQSNRNSATRIALGFMPLFAIGAARLSFSEAHALDPQIATSMPSTRPASQPTPTTTMAAPHEHASEAIRRLVLDLDSPNFKTREAAQSSLAKLGDSAMPTLVEFVGDKNPEIANRVAALVRRPTDPALRVQTAMKLLNTGDPDWIEMGVYMIFEAPLEDYDLVVAHAGQAHRREKAILEPVVEQLKRWRGTTLLHLDRIKKHKALGNIEAVKKEEEMQRGSMYYEAEAARMGAIDASDGLYLTEDEGLQPTSQATTQKVEPTSRPATGGTP